MPSIKSAIKKVRKDKRRQARNRVHRGRVKTLTTRFLEKIQAKDAAGASEALRRVQSALGKAAKRGVAHRKTISRKLSRLTRKLASVSA